MWFLSFADGNLPQGSQFLGGAIVRASHMIEAVRVAHILGINPGGEVQGIQVPSKLVSRIKGKWIERLLTREECEEWDEEMRRDG